MTRSGENSVAIGITIFSNAHKYSASPMPLVGHGTLTELLFVSKSWVHRGREPNLLPKPFPFSSGLHISKLPSWVESPLVIPMYGNI